MTIFVFYSFYCNIIGLFRLYLQLSELQITETAIRKYNVLVFILSMIYTQRAISLIDGFIIQFKMHKDSYCYLTLTILCSYCSTLLCLSITSKISYLNL